MKKLSKFIYFIFAFALITCMAIFNPAIDFASADGEASTSKSISISNSKIASSVEAGKDVVIPVPTVSDNTLAKYIVVTDRSGVQYTYDCATKKTLDKNGKEVTIKVEDQDVPVKYFTLLNAANQDITAEGVVDTKVAFVKITAPGEGMYKVQYKVVDEANKKTYYSEVKEVEVKSVAYSWEFNAANTAKNIIPSVTNANTKYTLPLPKIINSLDDAKSHTYTKADVGSYIKVTNSGKDVTNQVITKGETGDDNIYFTPTLEAGLTSDTYIIKYVSKEIAFADKTFTVEVKKDYNAKADLEVTYATITNYQIGAPITFPTANVTDKTHNKTNVEVNNVIVIEKGGIEYARLKPNQYTYTFTEEATYTIRYEVTDAYGNTATTLPKNRQSITPKDKRPYEVSYANNYTVSFDGTTGVATVGEVDTDVAYSIPNEVGYSGFWLPAIYAKDYVDGYEGLEFSRKLVSSADKNVWFDLDSADATHGNAAYEEPVDGKKKYNERIYFEFPETNDKKASDYAGESFKLVYTAKDSKNLENTAIEYTIKIGNVGVLTNNVDKNLIINFPTINKTIDPTETLTFTTATAKEDLPSDTNLVKDERIEVKTFYYYGEKATIEGLLKTYITKLSSNDSEYKEKYGYIFEDFKTEVDKTLSVTPLKSVDGKTDITLTGYTSQEKVTIFAVAINDQNQFVLKAQEVAINNTINDNSAPIIGTPVDTIAQQLTKIGAGVTAFNQGYEVLLPSLSFTDNDKSLQVTVNCYADTPDQDVSVNVEEFIRLATGECGIKTAKLTTTYAGTYYVVYTATDDAGNVSTYISTFEVAKTEKGYIEVENVAEDGNITANVGEEVTLNVNLVGDGDYENVVTTIDWGKNGPSSLGGANSDSFTFNSKGTYIATINATYTMNGVEYTAPSVTVTVTITEPTLEWADNVDEILVDRTANINETIELAIISATENDSKVNANKPVVKYYKNSSELSDPKAGTVVDVIFDQTTFNNYYFVADKNGIYEVTYTVSTKYNTESKSFTVTCGDYYDPTIIMGSNKLQDSTINYNGKDIALSVEFNQQKDENSDKIKGKYTLTVIAKDGDNELFNYDINVDLKDTDAEEAIDYFNPTSWSFDLTGDSVSKNGTNKWKITGVGEYELKLTIKDANGNAETKSISFKVSSKTEPKKVKDDVVGIVLIVISVVLLGGVILFFALAGKRNKAKRSSVRTSKD